MVWPARAVRMAGPSSLFAANCAGAPRDASTARARRKTPQTSRLASGRPLNPILAAAAHLRPARGRSRPSSRPPCMFPDFALAPSARPRLADTHDSPNANADVCITNPPGRGVCAQTSAGRNRPKLFIENRTKSSVAPWPAADFAVSGGVPRGQVDGLPFQLMCLDRPNNFLLIAL
jgi:hypothetical protein